MNYSISTSKVNKYLQGVSIKPVMNMLYEINKNWTKYEFIAQNAYTKVIEKYNTKYIFQQIQKEEEIWKS